MKCYGRDIQGCTQMGELGVQPPPPPPKICSEYGYEYYTGIVAMVYLKSIKFS